MDPGRIPEYSPQLGCTMGAAAPIFRGRPSHEGFDDVTSSSPATLMTLLVLGVFGAGCASTGAVPRPFPTPGAKPSASRPDPGIPAVESAIPNPDARPDESHPEAFEGRLAIPGMPIDGFSVAGAALQFRGTPYRLGGTEPEEGFDCSGLVHYVFARYGIAVPRDVRSQYQVGSKIEGEDIQPGDLLFFETEGSGASHVAIAISSRQFVHAPNSRGVVRVEMLTSDYWSSRYLGARRIIDRQ
jgi:cell wall-associated NlpC family hydrolase